MNSIAGAAQFLLDAARDDGWIVKGWTISDLELQQLRDEVGDPRTVLGNVPITVSGNDQESLTLHASRAVPATGQ